MTRPEVHPPKQYVRDLKERDSVASIFLASDKSILVDRNGKTYMSVNLSDSTGMINGRIWDRVEDRALGFEAGDFVRVKGFVQSFQSRRQIVIHEIARAAKEDVSLEDFVRQGMDAPEVMLADLMVLVSTMKDPAIRELTEAVLKDPEVKDLILKAPAAKSIHHAYMGGLLEHILSVAKLLNAISAHYSFLDRDLLLFGAIFHDIGKVWELNIEAGIKYTDRGRLVGHMVIACELIDRMAVKVPTLTESTKDILKHIILSHHGKLEYGSPKEPALPEAMVIAMIDELDSKLNTLIDFMRQELSSGDKWSRLSSHFGRYFLLERLRESEA